LRVFKTSAVTGAELKNSVRHSGTSFRPSVHGEQETGFLTNIRHQRLVEESLAALKPQARLRNEASARDDHARSLRALRPLDAITGETTTDDILNLIFSSFCIGK